MTFVVLVQRYIQPSQNFFVDHSQQDEFFIQQLPMSSSEDCTSVDGYLVCFQPVRPFMDRSFTSCNFTPFNWSDTVHVHMNRRSIGDWNKFDISRHHQLPSPYPA
jgi:hypothetical protein